MYSAESFSLKISKRTMQLLRLLANHMWPKISIRPAAIALLTKLFRQIEDDCNRDTVVLPGEFDNRLTRLGLDIRRIDHHEFSRRQTLPGNEVQNLESILRRRLVILVIRNQPAAEIRRQNLRGSKMLPGKARLPRPRGADQSDHRQFWNRQLHWRLKIPICVGLPTKASSGPIGTSRTAYPNRWHVWLAHD